MWYRDCFSWKPKCPYIQATVSSSPSGFLGSIRALWSTHHSMTAKSFNGESIQDQAGVLPSGLTKSSWISPCPAVGSPWKRCKHQLYVVSFMEIVLVVSTEARSRKEFRVSGQSIMATQNRLIGKMQRVSDPIFCQYRGGTMRLQRFCWSFMDLTQTS